jgi:hypothetical protein
MLSNKNRLILFLSAVLIFLISIQYILQLAHVSIFIIKNFILQSLIILLSQVFFFYLKKEYPGYKSSLFRINFVTTIGIGIIFISIYPLNFPFKEIFGVVVGMIILVYMLIDKEFVPNNFLGHSAIKLKVIIIAVCIFIGIFLRVYKLDELPIMVDEFTHLIQAKDILAGRPIVYTRSLLPITLPITLILKYLPSPIYWGRIYCVFLNMTAVVPIYFLLKQLDFRIGLVGVFLFATSPWLVFRSQMIREYSYQPVVIFTLLYLCIKLCEVINEVTKEPGNVKLILRKYRFSILGFILIISYFLMFDRQSMMVATLGLYGLFICVSFIILLMNTKNRKLWWISLCAVMAFMFIGLLILKIIVPNIIEKIFSIDISFHLQFAKYFLNTSISQWYYKSPILFWPIIIILSVFPVFKSAKKIVPIFLISAFFIYFILFSILLPEYSKPRYATFAEILYLPLYAIGIGVCILLIYTTFTKKAFLIATIISILISTNYPGIYSKLLKNLWRIESKQIMDGYVHPVTEEDLYGFEKIDRYFATKSTIDSVLVSSLYGNYAYFTGKPIFNELVFIHYYDSNFMTTLAKIIDASKSGFYVADDNRLTNPGFKIQQSNYCILSDQIIIQTDLSQCKKTMNYAGKYGRFFVWQWGE